MFSKAILKIIRLYQLLVSPVLGHHCRFYPSCSEYTAEAVRKYGFLEGLAKGSRRILKCQPLNKGGIDLP